MPPLKKLIIYPLEFIPIALVYGFFRILPLSWASWLGGEVARLIGPFLKISELGHQNLQAAFPKKTTAECEKILKGVWENLGRVAGEFPHLKGILKNTRVVGGEILDNLEGPAIFFAGHLANWELPHHIVVQHHLPIHLISRPPSNWFTRKLFEKIRSHPLVMIIIKGPQGSRDMIRALQTKGNLGILVDQRISDGAPVLFFGQEALTALGPAKLAYKNNALLVPVQVERLGHAAKFQVTFHPPFKANEDAVKTTLEINQYLEDWIRLHPDQWLWVHKRWKM